MKRIQQKDLYKVKVLRKRVLRVLGLFFLGCMVMGSSVAWAAPMLWSYPDDHVLISEVQPQGAPGASGSGTEWIEIYNPTESDLLYKDIFVEGSNGLVVWISTPTPAASGMNEDYPPLQSNCFLYLAYDAGEFYDTFKQCPDYADIGDARCHELTENTLYWPGSIDDTNESLCLYPDNPGLVDLLDSVGWGDGGVGNPDCASVQAPLTFHPVDATESYLRGSDAPVWIGPGGEGEEVSGTPASEQLSEVWNLSGSVDVPWEGVEVGACRLPTAVHLSQSPQAHTVQMTGYVIALLGLLGLLTLSLLVTHSAKS